MKAWYESKTVWFNVLFAIVTLAGAFGFADFSPSPEVVSGIGILISAVNLVLRVFFTNKGIE